ncbi:response regulator [Sedimenticola selenatireducens]|uniref:DNA-binding response regulator n=1 Tax=Sedimenticola selenatireducens TaxID=191960 RepID=A0A2N6D1L7_9GAMM|nr:response regulator [Sedimenticola selenatireducens]PLX63596.1 MAG: DNA-binding response regulator [Sedimenticola selenatireducens]
MRVLLVEDDQLLGDGLSVGLEQMGYTVDWITDGNQAEAALQDNALDLVILDISLPGQDGLTLLRRIRQQNNPIPVLLLTARDSLNDRVLGLDSGADDYLPKPFDLEELAARLRAISRRRAGRGSPLLRHGAITLDPAGRTVHLNDQPVTCTSREYAILEALLIHSGQVLSRQRLEEALYGWDDGVESNAIEVYIHHLRKKLGKSTIQTIRGMGYKIPKQADGNV